MNNIFIDINNEDFLVIDKFDLDEIKKNANILILGSSASGKTYLTKKILLQKNLSSGIINDQFKNYDNLRDSLYVVGNNRKTMKNIYYLMENEENDFLILEDIDNDYISAFLQNKNYLTIIIQQNIKFLENIDYLFITGYYQNHSKNYLFELYFNFLHSSDLFFKIFEECTKKYQNLVLDVKNKKIYWC